MQGEAIFFNILFSAKQSRAESGSFTAYLAPLCKRPWFLPEVPLVSSPFSKRRASIPLRARSRRIPAPVAPPPMTTTSVFIIWQLSAIGVQLSVKEKLNGEQQRQR